MLGFSQLAVAQQLDCYLHDPNKGPREHELDVQKMVLDVHFEPKAGKVMGTVTHTFTVLRTNIDTIFFDAPDITIEEIQWKLSNVKKASWQNMPHHTVPTGLVMEVSGIDLNLKNTYEVRIKYTATPKKGIYFIGWNVDGVTDPRNQTRKQIWTQGQGIDNRHWIPMYDNMNDKFVTETFITFDEAYKVLSNGELLSNKSNDGKTVWHYKMPHQHAGYLLMLAIDKYAVKKTVTESGVPVQFWYYPEHQDKLEYTSMYTERVIEFLERETGFKYAWGTYSQVMVQNFLYGAMENTSATIFGDFFLSDAYSFNDRNYISVNAHELTHQWFGDLITARSSAGTWLQESFATYYAKRFMREIYGDDEYRMILRGEVLSALRASEKDDYPVAHSMGGTSRVYPKGSTVLHMLRYVLGDRDYLRVIDAYLDKYAFKNVETNDLYQVIQDELGLNLDWFFDQWLYRGGEPHYEVSYQAHSDKTTMVIRQIQEQKPTVGLFKMPVNLAVYYTDGSSEHIQRWVEKQTEIIDIENTEGKTVAFVLFDENSEITKKVTFNRTKEELLAQLKHADHMIDRYDAIQALGDLDDEMRSALQEAYKANQFHGIREAIVRKLAEDKSSWEFLSEILPSADLIVRRAWLGQLSSLDETNKAMAETFLKDSSYNNISMALSLLVRSFPADQEKYLEQTSGFLGRNHDIRIPWLVYQITAGNSDYTAELSKYASDLYEFRTRISSFSGLTAVNYLDEQTILYLFDAATSLNGRLAHPAIETLKNFGKQESYRRMIQSVFDKSDLSENQKNTLKTSGVVH